MAELDEELEALRRADPVDPAAMPSSSSPQARALFERITMSDTDTTAEPRTTSRRWVAVAAAAAAVVAIAGGAIALGGDDDTTPTPNTEVATDSTAPNTTDGGPITPGGIASCVEQYSLETLANRDAAFDGTVEAVDGDTITFTVNEWFRGGEGDTTTRRGASTLGGITSAGPSVSLEPGTRLLVAGDDDFAWGCGFTQPYDAAVAAQWADTLGG